MADELRRGSRVVILVRHAERPPLQANDPTFGRDLALTARGTAESVRYGRDLLRVFAGEHLTVAAGGNRRCMETAFGILKGMGMDWDDHACTLLADPYLGGRSYYFGNVADRMELANTGDYIGNLNDYFHNGRQKGFNPLSSSTSLFTQHLLGHYSSRLFIGVTHDLNVACFLAGSGVATSFTQDSWPQFLDAAVLIEKPDYNTECHWLHSPTARSSNEPNMENTHG